MEKEENSISLVRRMRKKVTGAKTDKLSAAFGGGRRDAKRRKKCESPMDGLLQ